MGLKVEEIKCGETDDRQHQGLGDGTNRDQGDRFAKSKIEDAKQCGKDDARDPYRFSPLLIGFQVQNTQ